jgi:Flp pilus assembly secretin CpaC
MPEYDRDDGRMAPEEMAFRCLLFTINPLAAFLPLSVEEVQGQTLPAPTYVNHPPQYIPPSPAFPVVAPVPETVEMPREVERLEVMPKEVEKLDVMPRAEESEPQYQLLAPWTDAARLFKLPVFPLTEIQVSVQTAHTGSLMFGIGAEVSRSGTITVTTQPQSDAKPTPARAAPGAGNVLPPPRMLTDVGPRTEVFGAAQRVRTPHDAGKYFISLDCPTLTYEVIAGHTRLLHLKEAPIRIQVGDTHVLDYTTVEKPTELLLGGTSVGSTTMALWFGDRADPAKQTVLTLQVNVLPDPPVCRLPDVSAPQTSPPPAPTVPAPLPSPLGVEGAKQPREKQILLRCTLASVNRDAARMIGLSVQPGMNGDRHPTVVDNGRSATLIRALRSDNQAKCLAEPNLVALNGRPATFFTGGEFAVPVVTGTTCVGLQGAPRVPFGATLTFTPVITDADHIHLTLHGTVSALSPSVGSTDSPTPKATTVTTEVELREGQTFCLGGLLPAAVEEVSDKPVFGDLPLLGNLFRSKTSGSDVVLLVAPEVVKPLPAVPAAPTCPSPSPTTKESACGSELPQVRVSLLVAEVTAKGARKLNLDRPADGKSARWVIEVADEARQKALKDGMLALREKGQAKPIAEPNLCTLSGQQAAFLTGGELAVPVVTWLGQAGVQFEEFGTRVTCRPTVLTGGTIRLDVEPEISELCEVSGGCAQGVLVPGRSTQRVHTTADIPAGNTLVISGPKAGGDTRLVLFVTPSVVEPTPAVPQPVFDFDQPLPSHLTPERVHGGVGQEEASVHELLEKCRRELSRGHYAAAEDLVQRAIERDRQQVYADPIVRGSDLLQRVKATAALPLGTVEPCAAKGSGGIVPAGAAKAIGSDERVVQALMEEFNTAYKSGRYREAEALAVRARELDPENAMIAAAVQMSRVQNGIVRYHAIPDAPAPAQPVAGLAPTNDNTVPQAASAAALARFQSNFKEGRYEEAKLEALRALTVAPGSALAAAAFQQACEALGRQPRPQPVPQCTYVGTSLRPSLPAVDPAVVSALQKILFERDKVGPFGGSEEAEPKDDGSKPPRR